VSGFTGDCFGIDRISIGSCIVAETGPKTRKSCRKAALIEQRFGEYVSWSTFLNKKQTKASRILCCLDRGEELFKGAQAAMLFHER
jgi:hypothetical protein